jgi:hypothetical protein
MPRKKDIDSMNRLELMNELDGFRCSDRTAELEEEIGRLKHELLLSQASVAKLKKASSSWYGRARSQTCGSSWNAGSRLKDAGSQRVVATSR